jgi:hypothetical protein
MSNNKIYIKPYPIRISTKCEKAWQYLVKHKVNAAHYLREGGEMAVINKANEFYFKYKEDYCPF